MRLLLTTQPAFLAAVGSRRQPHRGRRLEKSRRKAPQCELLVGGRGCWQTLGGPGLSNHSTCPALGDPELLSEGTSGPPSAVRGQKFPRFSSFSMSMSKAWSATILFRRWFSFSSSFSFLASSAFMPPY